MGTFGKIGGGVLTAVIVLCSLPGDAEGMGYLPDWLLFGSAAAIGVCVFIEGVRHGSH